MKFDDKTVAERFALGLDPLFVDQCYRDLVLSRFRRSAPVAHQRINHNQFFRIPMKNRPVDIIERKLVWRSLAEDH
jgi:hypothetical protein